MTGAAEATQAAYVYGVVRAASLERIDAEGVGGAAVDVITHGQIAALVSVVPAMNIRMTRRDLHRHLRVLEEAFTQTTILPFRFGSAVESVDALQHGVLAENAADYAFTLARLDGCMQFNVKVEYVEEEMLKDIIASNPRIRQLRERTQKLGEAGYYEQIELGELVAGAIAERRERDATEILAAIEGELVDALMDEPDEQLALKASLLVHKKQRKEFDRKLEHIARERQATLRFEVIGPLPPTAFAMPAPGG